MENGPRTNSNYEKNCLAGNYGAIPDLNSAIEGSQKEELSVKIEIFKLFCTFLTCVGKSVGSLCNLLILNLYYTPWGSTKVV